MTINERLHLEGTTGELQKELAFLSLERQTGLTPGDIEMARGADERVQRKEKIYRVVELVLAAVVYFAPIHLYYKSFAVLALIITAFYLRHEPYEKAALIISSLEHSIISLAGFLGRNAHHFSETAPISVEMDLSPMDEKKHVAGTHDEGDDRTTIFSRTWLTLDAELSNSYRLHLWIREERVVVEHFGDPQYVGHYVKSDETRALISLVLTPPPGTPPLFGPMTRCIRDAAYPSVAIRSTRKEGHLELSMTGDHVPSMVDVERTIQLATLFFSEAETYTPARHSFPHCPACHTPLQSSSEPGVEIERCRWCGGTWLTPEALASLRALLGIPGKLLRPLFIDDSEYCFEQGERHCTLCGVPLEVVHSSGGSVETCPQCRGTWVDRGMMKVFSKTAPAAA